MSGTETNPRSGYVPSGKARIFYRETGRGQPVVILHGGPDFDHGYLLPDLDRLADSFRLVYYDQRGRGRSAENIEPEEVTLESEMEDIERVIDCFQFESVILLGHSWGTLLALEFALRQPERVSHLVILNTAPVSHADYLLLRDERRRTSPADIEELKARAATEAYKEANPDAVADYYRVHFRATVRQPEHLEQVVQRLRASFTPEGIRQARRIEKRLMMETWFDELYDLPARLKTLNIPTLIIHGDYDFVPVACAEHIAQAIPGAHFVLLENCGHFSYIERPAEVRREIDDFFAAQRDR